MLVFFRFVMVTSLFSLSACSFLGLGSDETEPEYDYTKARMVTQVKVPDTVGKDYSQDLYLVPQTMPGVDGEVFGRDNEVLPPLQILSLGNDVRANKATQIASAFVTKSEIELWDIVNRFIETDGINLMTKDIAEAQLKTDWVTSYEETFFGGRDPVRRVQYLIKVLDAERPNESRIDVQVLAAQNFDEDLGWNDYIDSKRAGAEFLNSILGYMYVDSIEESRRRVAESALGGITVNLGSDPKGNPALVTSSSFQQTWERVPLAMKMVNMKIFDKDRSQGLYFVQPAESDSGFFDALVFWSDDGGESLDLKRGGYRIQITAEGNKTYILFTDTDDAPLTADVLANNFPQLSRAFKARVKDMN